jgi:hypothetical protein
LRSRRRSGSFLVLIGSLAESVEKSQRLRATRGLLIASRPTSPKAPPPAVRSRFMRRSERQRVEPDASRPVVDVAFGGECTLLLWGSYGYQLLSVVEERTSDHSSDNHLHPVLHRRNARHRRTSRIRHRPRQAVANPHPAPPPDPDSAPQQADKQGPLTQFVVGRRNGRS